MRSEATINRRSPRSYISRTFPDARRGRSETGGMGGRLPGVEDDDGDRPLGVALVLVVARIDLREARPVARPLLVVRPPGTHGAALAADLDLGLGTRHQVVEPGRVL